MVVPILSKLGKELDEARQLMMDRFGITEEELEQNSSGDQEEDGAFIAKAFSKILDMDEVIGRFRY